MNFIFSCTVNWILISSLLILATLHYFVNLKFVTQDTGFFFVIGFNCSLFAYGQTGAGKSYSMVGYGSNK